MNKKNKRWNFFALSDATGDIAFNLAVSASKQFEEAQVNIFRRSQVTSPDKISRVVLEAHEQSGIIIYTLVSQDLRKILDQEAQKVGVLAIDVMGPVLSQIANFYQASPSNQPGLKYKLSKQYLQRNEAVEYTVHHDEGLGLETLDQADIILVGISRVSKTPLSIYLAHRGYKVANIPLALGKTTPEELSKVNPNRIVGLKMVPEKLADMRNQRLTTLGRTPTEKYASVDYVKAELDHSFEIFASLGNCPVVDITDKAIEEVAAEILNLLDL